MLLYQEQPIRQQLVAQLIYIICVYNKKIEAKLDGLEEIEDDFDFKEQFSQLKAEFEGQLKEESDLNQRIQNALAIIDLKVQ